MEGIPRPTESSSDVKFEIGHVLFIDVVGYSKLLINEQSEQIRKLKEIVRGTEQVRIAETEGKLLRLPTGDGAALVFRNNPEAPALCALEISKALKNIPELQVRMGIHSGPVNEVTDLNEQANIAGAGINMAQRVMDCGDAGHILLSKRVTDDLEHYPQWRSLLHDLGEAVVKHGVWVHIFSLYNKELGNPEVPEKLRLAKAKTASAAVDSSARREEGFWVAVLPFKYAGSNSDLTALAERLTEEIVTGLSRFSYLKVISRSSTSRYASESVDVRSAGRELGARYVMEGSLRQAGTKLRLAVQLVDAVSGAHLWAENYERNFTPESVFELQDDLVPRIVSTVADMNGVLPRSMSQAVRGRTPEQLSPYEAVLRSFGYFEIYTPEELSAARSGLETAVRKAPTYADAWAMLSCLCAQDYIHAYELQANALEIAVSAARRAVELGPSNHLAYFSLAQSLWSQRDFDSLRDAAERSVALNPMDGNSVALLGEYLTYAGSAERGMQLAERAKQLNPNHPGSYWYADFYHAFSQGDYHAALAFALKVKLRGNPLAPMMIAAACGQLGDIDGGAKAVADLVNFRPELPAIMRKQVSKVWNPEYGERFLEGLLKAGLEIPETGANVSEKISASPADQGKTRDSGAARADEGFWVAVLPFKYAGANADLSALADGLSEDIITGLSRFSYLRVIARSSIASFARDSGDVRTVGKELGARYFIEGGVRQAGSILRITVQLVDTTSGAHLWAESYDRVFEPEKIFTLVDDVVPRIVSTVADMHGVLLHTMSEALRSKKPESLTPYEAVLRSFGYIAHISVEEHAKVRACLELAIERAPTNADVLAMLSNVYAEEYKQGFNVLPESLERALNAARRSVDAAPSSSLSYHMLAQAFFFRREFEAFRNAAERAIALNPMDACTVAFMGILLAYTGEWERGCALTSRAMELNPNHPGWYRFSEFNNAYRKKDYRGALDVAVRFNMPSYYYTHAALAAAAGQLGDRDTARRALRELLAQRPAFATSAREDFSKWMGQSELLEHVLDGLRKAGLEISDKADASAAKKERK